MLYVFPGLWLSLSELFMNFQFHPVRIMFGMIVPSQKKIEKLLQVILVKIIHASCNPVPGPNSSGWA